MIPLRPVVTTSAHADPHIHGTSWEIYSMRTNSFFVERELSTDYLIAELFRDPEWPRFDQEGIRIFANLSTKDNPHYGSRDGFFNSLACPSGNVRLTADPNLVFDVATFYIRIKEGANFSALINHANANWFVNWVVYKF